MLKMTTPEGIMVAAIAIASTRTEGQNKMRRKRETIVMIQA